MPGERLIVLASPGFFAQTTEATSRMAELLNLAAKSNVIISGLSARGIIVAQEEQDVAEGRGSGRKARPRHRRPANFGCDTGVKVRRRIPM
jgi:hypothetical protein